MFPITDTLSDKENIDVIISKNNPTIKPGYPCVSGSLVQKCCDTLIDWLLNYHEKCGKSNSICKYSSQLIECLPNINCIEYVYKGLIKKGKENRITCLYLQLSFAKHYLKFYSVLPFNNIYLKNETCIIEMFHVLNQMEKEIYKKSHFLVHISFATYVTNIEKLPQFNAIGSVSLYLPRNVTEKILIKWISYLKFQKDKCWNHIQYLIIENIPTSLILYKLLLVLPSLKYIVVGSHDVSMIEDVPILKKSLVKSTNVFTTTINDNLLKYKLGYSKTDDNKTSKFFNVLYDNYNDKNYSVNLQAYSIVKQVIPLKRADGTDLSEAGGSSGNRVKVMKKPNSKIKRLFGHKI